MSAEAGSRASPERSRADERGPLGEFAFDGTTALAAIAHLYDPAAATDDAVTLAEFLASRHAPRAEALGFASDTAIDEVIQAFIEDDLAMQTQLAG